MRVADPDGPGEAMRMLDLVKLTLDCLAQFNLINVAQDEDGFDNLAKAFQCSIQRVLLRIGVEASENLRGGCLLQLYSRYQAQDVVLILFDELGVDVTRRFDPPRRTVDVAAADSQARIN